MHYNLNLAPHRLHGCPPFHTGRGSPLSQKKGLALPYSHRGRHSPVHSYASTHPLPVIALSLQHAYGESC